MTSDRQLIGNAILLAETQSPLPIPVCASRTTVTAAGC